MLIYQLESRILQSVSIKPVKYWLPISYLIQNGAPCSEPLKKWMNKYRMQKLKMVGNIGMQRMDRTSLVKQCTARPGINISADTRYERKVICIKVTEFQEETMKN